MTTLELVLYAACAECEWRTEGDCEPDAIYHAAARDHLVTLSTEPIA